jgi:uncharacterized damage-inducible protein DinB
MNKQLQKLYDSIEAQRINLLSSVQNLPADKLNGRLQGKWSINQIIAHLIAAERLTVTYIEKKIQGVNDVDDSGLREELKMILLILSQRLPFKFRAPKVVVENTAKETELSKLADNWGIVRTDFKKLLDGIEDQHLRRKIYKHVRVGMMNITHAVKFFREHVSHHTPQIKKLLK